MVFASRWVALVLSCLCINAAGGDKFSSHADADQCKGLFASVSKTLPLPSSVTRITEESMANPNIALNNYIRSVNKNLESPQVVAITFDSKSLTRTYSVQFGSETEYFALKDIDKIAQKIHQKLGKSDFVYWLPNGFSSHAKAESFESTLRVQLARLDESHQLRSIEFASDIKDPALRMRYSSIEDLPETLFVPGARIKSISEVEQIAQGMHKGWFSVMLKFVVAVGQEFKSFTVSIILKSRDIATDVRRFVNELNIRSGNKNFTAAMAISTIEHAMQKKYPKLNSKEIGFLLQEEFAQNYLVLFDDDGGDGEVTFG